jgi:hypothetical protein
MQLTDQDKRNFLIGLGVLNFGGAAGMSEGALASEGENICNQSDIVTTHEVLADFVKNNGSPRWSVMTPCGLQIHEWTSVQFRKGQVRGSLYLMKFKDISATYYTGG